MSSTQGVRRRRLRVKREEVARGARASALARGARIVALGRRSAARAKVLGSRKRSQNRVRHGSRQRRGDACQIWVKRVAKGNTKGEKRFVRNWGVMRGRHSRASANPVWGDCSGLDGVGRVWVPWAKGLGKGVQAQIPPHSWQPPRAGAMRPPASASAWSSHPGISIAIEEGDFSKIYTQTHIPHTSTLTPRCSWDRCGEPTFYVGCTSSPRTSGVEPAPLQRERSTSRLATCEFDCLRYLDINDKDQAQGTPTSTKQIQ